MENIKNINYFIIVADKEEVNSLEKFHWKLIFYKNNWWIYEKNNKKILVIYSGIGIVNAASTAQLLIDKFPYLKTIYNYGAVGAYGKKLKVFDVIIPHKIYFYDVKTPWYPLGKTPGENEFYFNNYEIHSKINLGSGNSFLYNEKEIKQIQKEIPVNIFDMESAAISQVCFKNNKNFITVKCVSDIIGSDQNSLENINLRIKKAGIKSLEYLLNILK